MSVNNWNGILSNTRNLNDVLIILRKVLAQLSNKIDITQLDEVILNLETTNKLVLDDLEILKSALNSINEQGGWYKPYLTEALLLVDKPNVSFLVGKALDTKKTFAWTRISNDGEPIVGSWEDTGLSELDQAINFANANGLFEPIVIPSSNTVKVDNFKTKGWYIVANATVATSMNLPTSTAGFLFVIDFNEVMIHQKWMPFNSNDEYTRTSNVSAVFSAFQKIITQKDLDVRLINDLAQYVSKENIAEYTAKPYDIVTYSKNLYDEDKKQQDLIVGNNGALQLAAGWSCSDFIEVEAGQYYTISFEAKRQNLAFYSEKSGAGLAAIEFNTSASNPLTVQAPIGAKYLVVTLDSTTITASKVQVEKGQSATSYEKGGKQYVIDSDYLSSNVIAKRNLKIEGESAVVNGMVDGVPISLNLSLTKTNTHDQSNVFNFSGDYVNNILQRNLSDDVAPMRLDGTTIGANHGYQKSNLTLANHGKTVADIGSVWSSGGKEYVIVDIVSSSILSITSRADNTAFVLAQLTHISGASNTVSFTPTATASAQWYPSIRDRKLSCFVDDLNIDLSKAATYDFKRTVKFLESYSILKKSDMVEWLIANPGVNHTDYNVVPAYTVNFGYTFDHECGCTIYFGGVGRKTVALVDQMITQSVPLATGNGMLYYYIPKAVAFTAGGYTYNFQNKEDIRSKNPSAALYLTAARQEASTNPIDRIIMLNDQIGYATGYLPVLDAAPNVRPINASNRNLEIRNSSLKIYPRLIDSAAISQINDGDAFAAIAYRKYFKRSQDRTCKYTVRSELGSYLYLDWHTAKTDEIDLPSDLVGRDFEIIEKSSNVTLLSKFASNSILVKVDASKNYGYLVLKFK